MTVHITGMNASYGYGPLTERVVVTLDAGVFTGTFLRQWPADLPGMALPVVWPESCQFSVSRSSVRGR